MNSFFWFYLFLVKLWSRSNFGQLAKALKARSPYGYFQTILFENGLCLNWKEYTNDFDLDIDQRLARSVSCFRSYQLDPKK